MTANKKIFLNVIATYGRSLFALACGLFTARWVLQALGQEDFGLYGVIGGLVVFISFFNSLLGTSLSRFYAVSVGAVGAASDKDAAINECRGWFSSAIFVHSVVPLVLVLAGWPLGEKAICDGWVAIPADRLNDCLWVFRFSCVSCFISMVTVPFNAMYIAKQRIAELTIYSFATTTLNCFFFYYISSTPGKWLVPYAEWISVMSLLPAIIISIRALISFPECRLIYAEMLSTPRMKALASFAGWQAFGAFGSILRGQGIAILLNRHVEFGSMRNSSMSVANQLAGQADTFASAMVGAFQPAIANAFGARDFDGMRSLAYRTCKFSTVLSGVFALPLALEIHEVLNLWLCEPPVFAATFCIGSLIAHLIDRLSVGHMLAVNAAGRVATYQAFLGTSLIMAIPVACIFMFLNLGVVSIPIAIVLTGSICSLGRVVFAQKLVGMSIRFWFARILFPISVVFAAALVMGLVPRLYLAQSFTRVVVSSVVIESVLLCGTWLLVLDVNERSVVQTKLISWLRRP